MAVFTGRTAAATENPYSVGLIGGEAVDEGYLAGIAVTMAPGWKTYWRVPGESGVPPEFNWERSHNLAGAEVLFPVPSRFVDAGGEGIGYHDAVVFPVRVTPKDKTAPVELGLDLLLAVCKDICIPARAQSGLLLGTATPDPALVEEVRQALLAVPQAASPPVVTKASVAIKDDHPVLVLTVADGTHTDVADVFVEGDGSAYFRAPRRDAGGALYLPVDGLKTPADLHGKTLTLTIAKGSGALEQRVTVD
jgi:DsbC/DsbD-like thiol-disulfide interchange protein